MIHSRSHRLPISALILAKNEEKCLNFCLPSLKKFVKEIIVFDTGSRDRTTKVARSHGAKVVATTIDKNNWSNTRNRLIGYANEPWILMFDADYRIADKDLPRLSSIIKNPKAEAYQFQTRNYSNSFPLFYHWKPCQNEYPKEEKFSKCFGYYDSNRVILFRNQPGFYYGGRVHEIVNHSIHKNGLRILDSDILVHHFELLKGMNHHLKKHAHYLKLGKKDVEKWPNDKKRYLNYILDFIMIKYNLREARKLVLNLIKLDPHESQSWCLRGIIEMQTHRLNLAEKYFKKSVALQPLFSNLCLLGWLYLKKNNLGKSWVFLKKALAKQPNHPVIINLQGILHERSKQPGKALLLFQKASRIHPGYAEPIFNQAVVYQRLGQTKQARILYKKAKKLNAL